MTFTDPKLEKFYLFAKLLLKQLPFERVTLPREVMDMVSVMTFRTPEEAFARAGSIPSELSAGKTDFRCVWGWILTSSPSL